MTISRHLTRVQNERAPEHDRLEVRGRLEGSTAVVEVAGNLACLVRDEEMRVVRHDTIRRSNASFVTLEVLGCGLGGLALVVSSLGMVPVKGRDPGQDDSTLGTVSEGRADAGLALMAAAGLVGMTEGLKARDSTEERTVTRASPTYLGACAGSGAQGRLISLVAPGANLAAVADAQGVASIPIDDATWERNGGVFEAEVRLDGMPVGRIRLVRGAQVAP